MDEKIEELQKKIAEKLGYERENVTAPYQSVFTNPSHLYEPFYRILR